MSRISERINIFGVQPQEGFSAQEMQKLRWDTRLKVNIRALMRGRQKELSSDEKVRILGHVKSVGPEKPLGYLPFKGISACDSSVDELQHEATEKGLWTKTYKPNECWVQSGALFVADMDALERLLQERSSILATSGWSSEPEKFINDVATRLAKQKTPLFDVVADAFADYTNPGRTDVDEHSK